MLAKGNVSATGTRYAGRGQRGGGVRALCAAPVAHAGGVGWGYRAGRWYIHTHTLAPAHPRLDDGTSRAARRQARCVDQASVNSGQTDSRRQTPEGGGTGGRQTHHVTAIIICFAGLLQPDPSMHASIQPTHPATHPSDAQSTSTAATMYKVSDPAHGTVYSPPSTAHAGAWTRAPPASCTTASGRGRLPDSSPLTHPSVTCFFGGNPPPAQHQPQHQHQRQRQRQLQLQLQLQLRPGEPAATATNHPPHPVLPARGPQVVAAWGAKGHCEA